MKTFLLTWNPYKWSWDNLAQMANRTSQNEVVQDQWSCSTKKIEPQDRCFLMMVGKDNRGLIASGWATSLPYLAKHWDPDKAERGEKCQYVDCEWEKILNPEPDSPLLVTELEKAFAQFDFHWTPQNSGIQIPNLLAMRLEDLWAMYIGSSTLATVDHDPEILAFEGAERMAMVRHKRREQKLRRLKIEEALKKGNGHIRCDVEGCGFDFYNVYGDPGFGFAHVHHLKPLADLTTPTATKLKDLAIVCANCHSMIHHGGRCRPLTGLIKQK